MITSRLTAIMVAMSLLGAGAPIAAMAQATADNDALQAEGEESSSEAESEAEATSAVANSTIFANNAQSATTNQLNLLEDNDDVTVNATQAALQAAIAADVDIGNATATEIGDLLELFGLDVDGPVLS
jgi:prophage DNA circulation protein